jgi:hypothetical protein
MTTVLTLGACTGTNDGPGSRASTRGGQASPVSPEAYRRALATITEPLDSALTALDETKAYKGLTQRITAAEQAAAQASVQLGQMKPPTAVAAEHARLVAAVRRLDGDLKTLSGDVRDRKLCTTSSVSGGLGRGDGAAGVRDAATALTAKAPEYRIALRLPAAGQERTRRLPNGRFVRSGGRAARGTLTIDNGGGSDAVITLAKGKHPVYSVYVRKDKTYTVTGVNDGTYKIFFTGGADWDAGARAFTRDCEFQQFEDQLAFRTQRTSTQIRWSTWKITLQPVAGGTARTSEVAPEDFPAS